jgi:hypothetical protein
VSTPQAVAVLRVFDLLGDGEGMERHYVAEAIGGANLLPNVYRLYTEAMLNEAYAEGRKDEREHLERIGAVSDCPSCGGSGERMASMGQGPHMWQDLIDCPNCHGSGYAKKP